MSTEYKKKSVWKLFWSFLSAKLEDMENIIKKYSSPRPANPLFLN